MQVFVTSVTLLNHTAAGLDVQAPRTLVEIPKSYLTAGKSELSPRSTCRSVAGLVAQCQQAYRVGPRAIQSKFLPSQHLELPYVGNAAGEFNQVYVKAVAHSESF